MDKFTFYSGWKWLFKPLSDANKGALLMAVIEYYETGRKADFEDESTRMALGYIINQIDRDKKHQKEVSRLRRKAGLKGAATRKNMAQ